MNSGQAVRSAWTRNKDKGVSCGRHHRHVEQGSKEKRQRCVWKSKVILLGPSAPESSVVFIIMVTHRVDQTVATILCGPTWCTDQPWNLDLTAPKQRPSPLKKRGDANLFLSILLFVCKDWLGWWGRQLPIHFIRLPTSVILPTPHSLQHTHTHNGVRSPYTSSFLSFLAMKWSWVFRVTWRLARCIKAASVSHCVATHRHRTVYMEMPLKVGGCFGNICHNSPHPEPSIPIKATLQQLIWSTCAEWLNMSGKDDQSWIWEKTIRRIETRTRVGLKSHLRPRKDTAKFPHLIDHRRSEVLL